jgi:uncharacterized protein
MVMKRMTVASVMVCQLLAAATAVAQDLPQPTGRINDFANVLDDPSTAQLDSLLETLEKDTTAEVAVATVASLDGLTVEEYATRLFNAWGVGQKGKDNGVLVLVVPAERAMRIEVGYGLEGVLPDGLAGALIREQFVPAFRNDDYQAGIVAGVRRIEEIVRRNEILSSEQRRALERVESPGNPLILAPVLFIFFGPLVAAGSYFLGVGIGARVVMALVVGGVFAGIGLLLSYGTLAILFWVNLAIAVALFWIGLKKTRSKAFVATLRSGAKGSGWIVGASGSSGRSGSSRSGGSSGRSSGGSFGGGRSGGGGASGRW